MPRQARICRNKISYSPYHLLSMSTPLGFTITPDFKVINPLVYIAAMGRPRIIMRPTPMLRKQIGVMRKLLGTWGDSKVTMNLQGFKNPKNPQPIMIEGKPEFLTKTEGVDTSHITRRQIVLNRHFTEIISDILANNLKKQLSDLGVSIRSIETKAWNKGVRIYYTTDGPFEASLHDELNSLITQLRFAVSERRLIGKVPLISFVYDESVNIERILESALKSISKTNPDNSVEIATTVTGQLQSSTTSCDSTGTRLLKNKFSAPSDMSNMMLGLDYPSLYSEVTSKLERGREQSSRMISDTCVAPLNPIFRDPEQVVKEEEDPVKRIHEMQRFLILQRKKAEHHARLKRKQELLSRDTYKWDAPDESEVGEIVEERDDTRDIDEQ